ncbi:MAG: molybdopterin dinucleotide binding domain-containing protein, partial [Nannocystaceae bacterium]
LYAHLRPPVVPVRGQGLPEAEIYARLARATGIATAAPAALRWVAARKSPRTFATAFLGAVMTLSKQSRQPANMLFWIYELLGPHLPAPPLAAVWALSHLVTRNRRDDITRGTGLKGSDAAVAEALFDRILAHPQGVVVGKCDEHRNLENNLRHPDKRIKLAHAAMLAELARALLDPMTPPPGYPLILQAGRRTRWNANTIHRDPSWRKGKQSGCRLYIHPNDATSQGLRGGDRVAVKSSAGEVFTVAELDSSQLSGHVSLPNGFGMTYLKPDGTETTDGVSVNVLTSAHARDPFTGIPHHKWVPVQVTKVNTKNA